MTRARAAAFLLAGSFLVPAAAFGQPRLVPLPDPGTPVTTEPPLASSAQPLPAPTFPSTTTAATTVRVGLTHTGEPTSIVATQRLTIGGQGDYAFIVRAPVTDVRPGPGTQSEPGFRRGAIVWQGFSPGRRSLAATATLGPSAAESLPVLVRVRAAVDGRPLAPGERRTGTVTLTLELQNRTGTTVESYTGLGIPAQLARVLDEARSAVTAGRAPSPALVRVTEYAPAPYRADAGIHVSGSLTFPRGRVRSLRVRGGSEAAGGVRFRATLGGGHPLRFVVRLTGRGEDIGAPVVRLEAVPVRAVPGLRPPRGGTWAGALGRRAAAVEGRRLLATAVATFLRLARVTQYESFLQNPHPSASLESTSTRYVYETAVTAPTAVVSPGGDGGVGTPGAVLVVVGALVALGAAVIAWAQL